MTKYQAGTDALDALNEQGESEGKTEWTSFKLGSSFIVKPLGTADLISFFSYGIRNKVNSFSAKDPSKKSAKGYPVDNYTPWDKAWKYHKDLSETFNDQHGIEAGKYRAKHRFAMGFIDLDTGQPIIVDFSKNQAQVIHKALRKYEKKIGKMAFELSKDGNPNEPTSTTVSLTPIIDFDDDLTDKQKENFGKAPEEFDMTLFDGLLYEADEAEQLELLTQAGFDITLIGYGKDEGKDSGSSGVGSGENGDITDDDLPF